MVSWCYVLLLLLISCVNRYTSLLNDYVALEVPLIYDNVADSSNVLRLKYSELRQWKSIVEEYAELRGIPKEDFVNVIVGKLEQKKYELLEGRVGSLDSHSSISALSPYLDRWHQENGNNDYYLSIKPGVRQLNSNTGQDLVSDMLHANEKFIQTVPQFLLSSTDIIIYQSLGVSTGGTTAMNILFSTLQRLGFKVLLCNDSNKSSLQCKNPNENQLVITGEWCHEVLDEYMNPTDEIDSTIDGGSEARKDFLGRGLQYYLGFHHNDDACVGRVAIADSHFISKHIGRRQLSAYYLGCPMTPHFLSAYETIRSSSESDTEVQHIMKENLIVVDPDYNRDYPPENKLSFDLPPGYSMVYAQEIPPSQMPLLLQRAKMTLDLGMPGPERLSGEAILSGTIPIVSERMNGASEVDFPGVRKVNPYNGSEITDVLQYVADHFEEELTRLGNAQFLHYMLSMQHKLLHTSNVVFASSAVHFVLSADDLHSEYLLNFQLLSLLYLYPLASIDIYVYDVVHYMRHHYTFIDLLKQSGYMRVDPLQPRDFKYWRKASGGKAFVSIYSLSVVKSGLQQLLSASSNQMMSLKNLDMVPSWNPVLIVMKPGLVPRHPTVLLDWLTEMNSDSTRVIVCSSCESTSVAMVAGPDAAVDHSLLSSVLSFLASPSNTGKAVDSTVNITSVCGLLEGTANDIPSVLDTITDTIHWRTVEAFSRELSFSC